MTYSDSVVRAALHKIRSSLISTERSLFGNHFIARTGVYSRIPGIHRQLFFGGFSCKPSSDDASSIAPFEVAERLLATYFFSSLDARDSCYELFAINSKRSLGYVTAEEVILGPTPSSPKNDQDAVGLGFHTDEREAIEHAIFELVERNLLGRIWYEGYPIIQVSRSKFTGTDYFLSIYRLPKAFPFAMAILSNARCHFLCVGASVANTFSRALEKASAEAIMLAHDLLSKKATFNIEKRSSRRRLESQKDVVLSQRRNKYLSQICLRSSRDEPPENYYSLDLLLDRMRLKERDIGYCSLHASRYGHLIRAVSSKLKSLRAFRKEYAGTERFLLDPVC